MLLRRDFYKEIKVCPVCGGYGVLNREDPSHKHKYCDKCEGFGVFIDEERGRIVFGLPIFVDFQTRRTLITAKYFVYLFLILIIIISIAVIF